MATHPGRTSGTDRTQGFCRGPDPAIRGGHAQGTLERDPDDGAPEAQRRLAEFVVGRRIDNQIRLRHPREVAQQVQFISRRKQDLRPDAVLAVGVCVAWQRRR